MDHHVSESLNGNCHQWIVDIFYVCSITTSLMMCETGNKSSKQFYWGINDQECFKRTCQIFLTSVAYLSTSQCTEEVILSVVKFSVLCSVPPFHLSIEKRLPLLGIKPRIGAMSRWLCRKVEPYKSKQETRWFCDY